jgi:hypothetical protein
MPDTATSTPIRYRVLHQDYTYAGCRIVVASREHTYGDVTEAMRQTAARLDELMHARLAELVRKEVLTPFGHNGCLVIREFEISGLTFCIVVRAFSKSRLTEEMFNMLVFEQVFGNFPDRTTVQLLTGHVLVLQDTNQEQMVHREGENCDMLGITP